MYLVHGTSEKNYKKIIKDGILKVDNSLYKMTNNNEKGIFCQLMIEEFENEITWFPKKIKLDIKILKDLKFDIYQGIGSFDKDIVPFKIGKGNYKRLPSMNKIIKMIKDYIKTLKYIPKKIRFMHSHEIIIRQDIDLKKYMIF
jgi:hypothetical protein